MSTERLRENLLKEDFAEGKLAKMSREEMMEAWARVEAVRKTTVATATAKHDPALERERLEFERQKFQQEIKMERRKWPCRCN